MYENQAELFPFFLDVAGGLNVAKEGYEDYTLTVIVVEDENPGAPVDILSPLLI